MAVVTITNPTAIDGWEHGGTTGKLRWYANKTFTTAAGKIVPAGTINTYGQWAGETAAAVSSRVVNGVTIPTIDPADFQIDSTIDALDYPNAKYTFVWVDEDGNEQGTLATVDTTAGWSVPATISGSATFTLAQLAVYNATLATPPTQTFVASFNTRAGAVTLTSADVTTALGFTPATALTVREVDGSPSIAGATVIEFLESSGLVVTNPSGTIVRVALGGLTASRALASDGSGVVSVSAVTATELGYLSGVTSAIQTQLNGKAASSHNHNASDINAGTLADARLSNNVTFVDGTRAFTGTVSGITPTLDAHLATKAYVDSVASGLDIKQSVRAATTGNVTLSGEQTIDGVAVVAGDRVLVKDQSTGSQNGIYVAAVGAWSRSTDADTSAEVTTGLFVFVSEGTTNADSGWVLTTNDPITLGTTALSFSQFSGAGQITAGAGLTKTGNTLDVIGTANRITVSADAVDIAATYVGQTSITTLGTIATGTWEGTAIALNKIAAVTASRALVSDVSGFLSASAVTATELGHLAGVTSAIQTQLNAKAASGANTDLTSVYLNNTGLKVKDTDATHGLTLKPGSNLTADKTLTITTGDADRTLTLNGDTTLSGTNTGDQTITLTGDVTGTGTGSFAATIAADAVTFAKMQNIATARILGRTTAASGDIEELDAAGTKTLLSLSNVENTALSTWAGSTNLTTLGTIATGTWQGSIIGSAYGGTGNGFTKFTGPTTTEKTFTLPNASATILTDNAAVTVGQGGTGAATFTANGVLYGNAASALQVTAQGAANSILTANAGAPAFSQTPIINTSAQIGVASLQTGSLKLAHASTANITTIEAANAASAVTIRLPADDPAVGELLKITSFSGGVAVTEWAAATGSPAGSGSELQFRNAGSFGAIAGSSVTADGFITLSPTARSSGVASYLKIVSPADTGMTASTESVGIDFDVDAIRTWATGALATQREVLYRAPTYAFAGASTITNAATVAISGAPIAGTNATITNKWSFWVQAGNVLIGSTPVFGNAQGPLQVTTASSSIIARFGMVDDTGGDFYIKGTTSTGFAIGSGGARELNFNISDIEKWRITTAAHLVAVTDNSFDIGATGATRPRNIYAATGVIAENNGKVSVKTSNAAEAAIKTISESITLSTSGTTTDSSADLLPANSIILAVVARVIASITTATDWSLGDANVATRFSSAETTLTAGTTKVGLNHQQGSVSTNNAGPVQASAAKLRITTTGTPGAGSIRVTVMYVEMTSPTS